MAREEPLWLVESVFFFFRDTVFLTQLLAFLSYLYLLHPAI